MQLRNTLVLMGVAIALVLFIVLFESHTRTTDELKEMEKRAFPEFKERKDRADTIEISKGADKLVMVKRDKGTPDERWQITHPIDYPADTSRVISLLGAFERAEKAEIAPGRRSKPLGPADDLSEFGLTQEAATRVRVSAGEETLLDALVGGATPTKGKVYAAPGSRDALFVVDDDVRDNATRRVDEYRDKRLLNLTRGTVTQVVIMEDEKLVAEIAREKEGEWRLVQPIADRADKQKANDIVDRLGSLWADAFKEDFAADDANMPKKLEGYGLRPAKRSIKLTRDVSDKPQQHELLFGNRVKKTEGSTESWDVYAMVAGTRTVVLLPETSLDKFTVKPDDLRDPKVAGFESSDPVSISIARASGELRLEKDGDDWKLAAPATDAHKADGSRVRDLLNALVDLRVSKFLPSETQLASPIRVEVGFKKDDKGKQRDPEVILFEPGQGESIKGRRGEKGAVFEVPSGILKSLTASSFHYWDRHVLDFSADKLAKLTIKIGDRTETATRENNVWKLAGTGELNTENADALKWALSDLTAEEVVGRAEATALGPWGLDAPSIRAEVEVAGEKPEEKPKGFALLIGRAEDEKAAVKRYYARLEGQDVAFLVAESVVEKLRKGLVKPPERPAESGQERKEEEKK